MRSFAFPARLRLKQRREFLRVQRGGRKHHVRHFLVFVSPRTEGASADGPPPTRLGITVTRKIGNAVTRNQIKRLVREVFRQHRQQLPAGLDMVWVAKQQAAKVSFDEVLADFETLARRGAELTGRNSRRSGGSRRGKKRAKR